MPFPNQDLDTQMRPEELQLAGERKWTYTWSHSNKTIMSWEKPNPFLCSHHTSALQWLGNTAQWIVSAAVGQSRPGFDVAKKVQKKQVSRFFTIIIAMQINVKARWCALRAQDPEILSVALGRYYARAQAFMHAICPLPSVNLPCTICSVWCASKSCTIMQLKHSKRRGPGRALYPENCESPVMCGCGPWHELLHFILMNLQRVNLSHLNFCVTK